MTEEMAIVESNATAIASPINGENPISGMYSSLKSDSMQERLEVFDAVSNAQALEDHINERINVENIIIQPVERIDKLTGEITQGNRITLIDTDKVAFACMSLGVETALKQLFGIVGEPPWKGGIPLVAVKQTGNNGYKFTTLQLWKGDAPGAHAAN